MIEHKYGCSFGYSPIFLPFLAEVLTKNHNYDMYYNGFKRTVTKHINKISNYKSNHPNAKCIFLVFDESSGTYYENNGNKDQGILHYHFMDKNFIDVFLPN